MLIGLKRACQITAWLTDTNPLCSTRLRGGGGGALPFMGYSEMFCCEGLSFQAVQSGIKGKERKRVMVWNKNTLWETDQLYEELEILC